MGVSRRADSCRCCGEIGRAGGMIFSFMPFNMLTVEMSTEIVQ